METRNVFVLSRRGCGGKGCLEVVGAEGRIIIIIKRIFKNLDESVRDGFIWLRIGTNSGML
jgi:hypothetical protein